MTKTELLNELQDVLQRDEELSFNMKLSDLDEWDSLAYISIISLYDQLFNKVITTYEIEKCVSIDDVINLVSDQLEN